MTAWTIHYENRFPREAAGRGVIAQSFRAPDGEQTVTDGPVILSFSGLTGFGLGEGRNITFRSRLSDDDVIGLDVTLRLAAIQLSGGTTTLFAVGQQGIAARLTGLGGPVAEGDIDCRLTIETPAGNVTVEGIRLRQNRMAGQQVFNILRLRWESKGQLHVWLNDDLIAYENAVAPGAKLRLDRLVIGDDTQPNSGVINVTISSIRVVELKDDAAAGFIGEAIKPETPPLGERCEHIARTTLTRLSGQLRAMLAKFIAEETEPWRAGMANAPFSDVARDFHDAARKAGLALPRFLASGEDAHRDAAIEGLSEVLTTLAVTNPELMAELFDAVDRAPGELAEHCDADTEAIVQSNAELLARLAPITTALEAHLAEIRAEI